MTSRRWVRALGRKVRPGVRGLSVEQWAALWSYGGRGSHVTQRSADDLVLADRDTDHTDRKGCAGCDLLARLWWAWLGGLPVGDPDTWHVSETTAPHVAGWFGQWKITASPEFVDAVRDFMVQTPLRD